MGPKSGLGSFDLSRKNQPKRNSAFVIMDEANNVAVEPIARPNKLTAPSAPLPHGILASQLRRLQLATSLST
jgi:hypothetical protein